MKVKLNLHWQFYNKIQLKSILSQVNSDWNPGNWSILQINFVNSHILTKPKWIFDNWWQMIWQKRHLTRVHTRHFWAAVGFWFATIDLANTNIEALECCYVVWLCSSTFFAQWQLKNPQILVALPNHSIVSKLNN